jgi:hypothetical protein
MNNTLIITIFSIIFLLNSGQINRPPYKNIYINQDILFAVSWENINVPPNLNNRYFMREYTNFEDYDIYYDFDFENGKILTTPIVISENAEYSEVPIVDYFNDHLYYCLYDFKEIIKSNGYDSVENIWCADWDVTNRRHPNLVDFGNHFKYALFFLDSMNITNPEMYDLPKVKFPLKVPNAYEFPLSNFLSDTKIDSNITRHVYLFKCKVSYRKKPNESWVVYFPNFQYKLTRGISSNKATLYKKYKEALASGNEVDFLRNQIFQQRFVVNNVIIGFKDVRPFPVDSLSTWFSENKSLINTMNPKAKAYYQSKGYLK